MIDERTLELIHAEIDAELDGTTRAELELRLQGDPEARSLRVDLVRVAAALARMAPVTLPAHLHERLTAAVPSPEHSQTSWPKRWFRGRSRAVEGGGIRRRSNFFTADPYSSHSHSKQPATPHFHLQGKKTMKTSKMLALSGLAVSIAAVVYFGLGYPPKIDQVAGTIAPAERYRAAAVDSVELGDQSIPQLMQTDTFTRLVKDPQFRALVTNAQFNGLVKNADFNNLVKNADFNNLVKNADFNNLVKNADFNNLVKNADFNNLVKNADFNNLVKNADFNSVMKNAEFNNLVKNADFNNLVKNADFNSLVKNADFNNLVKNADLNTLLKNADFNNLVKNADNNQLRQ
ncbi:MAG TPA: hypothetical protein VIE67_09915 [Rudaea sp.]|uniref:hypothetical protein n=1 Tax=Rudaea sp. TaxID=2136325 RepID=UPI002F91D72A